MENEDPGAALSLTNIGTVLSAKVRDRGYVTKRGFAGYEGVSGAPKKAVFPDLAANKLRMDSLAKVRDDINQFISDLELRLRYPFAFQHFDAADLRKKIKDLKKQLGEVESTAEDLTERWWVLSRKPHKFDPAKIVGELQASVLGAPVPLIVKVATEKKVGSRWKKASCSALTVTGRLASPSHWTATTPNFLRLNMKFN
jgi:hypothetical protein